MYNSQPLLNRKEKIGDNSAITPGEKVRDNSEISATRGALFQQDVNINEGNRYRGQMIIIYAELGPRACSLAHLFLDLPTLFPVGWRTFTGTRGPYAPARHLFSFMSFGNLRMCVYFGQASALEEIIRPVVSSFGKVRSKIDKNCRACKWGGQVLV